MAISKEDHHDVSKAFGKAIAKKIGRVTRDRYKSGGLSAGQRIERSLKDEKEGKVRKIKAKVAAGDLKFEKYRTEGKMDRTNKPKVTIYSSGTHSDY